MPGIEGGQASVMATMFNIISNVVGGGCLLLPGAFNDASLLPGIVVLILMGILATLSLVFIILACERTGKFTYLDLLSVGIGPRAAFWFEIVLLFYTYLILVGWSKIISDSMPDVAEQFLKLSHDSVATKGWFWLLAASCLFWPLTSLRAFAHLQITSILGFVTIFYVAVVMIVRFAQGYYTDNWDPSHTFTCSTWNQSLYTLPAGADNSTSHHHSMAVTIPPLPETSRVHSNPHLFDMTFQLVAAFPQLSVCFSFHYNCAPMYKELRRRSVMRMFRAVFSAFSTIAAFYIVFGTIGLLTFGEGVSKSKGDIVKCYSWTDTIVNISRLGLFLHFSSVYPLVGLACRRSINALIFPGKEMSQMALIIEAFFIVSSASIIAYVVPGIGFVFTLAGAFFGLSIVFIVPGVFYVKLFAEDFDLTQALLDFQRYQDEKQAAAAAIEAAADTPTGANNNNNNNGAMPSNNQSLQIMGNSAIQSNSNSGLNSHMPPMEDSSASYNSPKYTISDTAVCDQGYGTLSDTSPHHHHHGEHHHHLGVDGEGEAMNAAIAESIPTEWDKMAEDLVNNPSPCLRYVAWFNIVFGAAASILSIVNAFRDIADGKGG